MGTVRSINTGKREGSDSERKKEAGTKKRKMEKKSSASEISLGLGNNAFRVLEKRYLRKDDQGVPVESPEEMFHRVASAVAEAEQRYGKDARVEETKECFFRLMADLEMLPNSPTLMNAGRDLGQLSACFVLPVEDSMESIFEAIKHTAIIHKSGGGTGFSFSRVRPRNDQVRSTKGISSGPISFMTVFDAATETIKQGGMRRGANMGVLNVHHPDILEFIRCKEDSHRLTNFNISVGLSEAFIKAVNEDADYPLVNPRSGEVVGRLRARDVFDRIVESAWKNGEPGILFMDRINRDNPTPAKGEIESTNPCGEQPLLPFESCNLGSLNLAKMVCNGSVDWKRLAKNVRLSVRFLDNVIDVNRYPLAAIQAATLANRKIGLGVMGFADMLIQLGIPYDSEEAERLAESVMKFISQEAVLASEELAVQRGPFPNFHQSIHSERGGPPRRNATTTTIAPTGTISLIAGCSSGIEPLFAVAFARNVLDNERLMDVHPLFEKIAKEEGFFSDALLEGILEKGSLQGLEGVPEKWKRIFVTAHDISPEWHIRMQAAFQKYTENSVSKTVNFQSAATKEDVRKVFFLASELGCKGVTIYRDRSRQRQVLQRGRGSIDSSGREKKESSSEAQRSPRPRPQAMKGVTRRMDTSCGALYVTINWDEDGRPFEVFTSMGKAGGCAASQSEAIGRLVSLGLRSGVDPDQIVRQLRGISCHLPKGLGKKRISSCADAVAQALLYFFYPEGEGEGETGTEYHDVSPSRRDSGPVLRGDAGLLFLRGACPECKGPLEPEGACAVCRNCGYSDCM